MANNRALYEQVILDHNKSPRNFHKMDAPSVKIEGFNPLCGDQLTLYLKFDGDTIKDVSFEGVGCAISKSSASVMTEVLKGKTKEEAKALFEKFHTMITADPEVPLDESELGKLRVFGGVREFPVRIKCATLAWHALLSALNGEGVVISTEV
jgi:nitrogen fixation NifU-like protein